MRRLIVMRHAKSAWDTDAESDHARPLNKRGKRDAPRIAEVLDRIGWVPDQVVSSDSVRTTQTWQRMAPVLPGEVPVVFTRDLYHAGMGAVQQAVEDFRGGPRTVMVLGHNPGFERVVSWLTGASVRLTTANAALLTHPGDDWRDAIHDAGAWTVERVLRPKEL